MLYKVYQRAFPRIYLGVRDRAGGKTAPKG